MQYPHGLGEIPLHIERYINLNRGALSHLSEGLGGHPKSNTDKLSFWVFTVATEVLEARLPPRGMGEIPVYIE